MFDFLWQIASSTAHAANAQAAQYAAESAHWTAEQTRDVLVAVIGAIFAGFLALQNAQLKKQSERIISQNVTHEANAQARAQGRNPHV